MQFSSTTAPAGTLSLKVIRKPKAGKSGFFSHALPRRGLPRVVNIWRLKNLPRVLLQALKVSTAVQVGKLCGTATLYGRLSLRVITAEGNIVDYGVAGYRVVTTAGVTFLVDNLRGSVSTITNMKYHGYGTGTTAEASSDTALVTELTTQYAVDSTRPTGSQTNNGANVYETVATLSPDSGGTLAITEHGVFSATSAGTLLDRTKFAAINLDTTVGDSLQSTYDLTLTAGS